MIGSTQSAAASFMFCWLLLCDKISSHTLAAGHNS